MNILDKIRSILARGRRHDAKIVESLRLANAQGSRVVQRPREFLEGQPAFRDDQTGELKAGRRWITHETLGCLVPDPRDVVTLHEDHSTNVKTLVGIDFLHTQGYGSSDLAANGLNFIALSNDALTETNASTTLSSEIVANGLTRAQGVVAHVAHTSITTIAHTFTATGAQSCQKSALFTLISGGTMNHALAFTQRVLQVDDTILVTFTITLQ